MKNLIKKSIIESSVSVLFIFIHIFILILLLGACSSTQQQKDYVKHVNPFIGTGESGNCIPAATSPFGMISWGPNTNFDDYDWYDARPGYKYSSDKIISFSLTHYSGIGCHATRDIPFSFTSKKPLKSPVNDREEYASTFSHSNEYASPGEYGVLLDEGNISVKMTSAERSSIAVVKFDNEEGSVVIAPGNNANGVWDAYLEIDPEEKIIKGYGGTGGFCDAQNTDYPYIVYFVASFDSEIESFGAWENENITTGMKTIKGDSVAAYLTFKLEDNKTLKVKTAISYVSIENAMINLEDEIPEWDYDAVVQKTQNKWNDVLSRIDITSDNPDDYETFYTALYHNCLHPNIFDDVNGEYIGFDDKVHTIEDGHHFYVNFSLWDTYRTSVQLQSMLFPDRMNDMLNSILLSSVQGGGMPVWSLNNTDNGCMNGFSVAPFIANAYAFGANDIPLEALKNKLVASGTEYFPIKDSRGWSQIEEYKNLGYVPHPYDKSVSKTAEYSIADYSIAQICKFAGDSANHQYFLDRSNSIFNLINPELGYLQKKSSDGLFVKPFDITDTEGFDEGNTAHYTFGIPHATAKLVDRIGGADSTNKKLDQFFSTIYTKGWNIAEPHYWLGNEPCFATPFVYNYTGESYESQRIIKEITALFTTGAEGLSGDDDAGAMSAYYMFGTMGLYPYIPGTGGFLITGPVFEKIKIKLGDGNSIELNAPEAGHNLPYIGSLAVNGQPWNSAWINWGDLEQGAILEFQMQNEPCKTWEDIKGN
ncbi:MAG: GH92 family glycosyl hydrolase [Prolixibacteraceae bacterium]|nr:GH92 family glycosyl hydrolase [Prolixibacteraceae bacterium]